MSKYSYEFKKKVVQAYLNGEGGYGYLAKEYGIKSQENIRNWVNAYREFGDKSLMRSRQNKNYTFEFKLDVVESYLTTEVSYQELALSVGINNPTLIVRWVNDYRAIGPDALKPRRKGRKPKVDKPKNIEKNLNENDKEYLKQLEEENLKLRIENAYLKELRRLRLEEKANLNKRQESSKASEKNSN